MGMFLLILLYSKNYLSIIFLFILKKKFLPILIAAFLSEKKKQIKEMKEKFNVNLKLEIKVSHYRSSNFNLKNLKGIKEIEENGANKTKKEQNIKKTIFKFSLIDRLKENLGIDYIQNKKVEILTYKNIEKLMIYFQNHFNVFNFF